MDGDTQMTINLQGGADTGAISRAMLLAGHGKPSNGSATTAKFVDMHQDLNNIAQAKYTNRGADTAKDYIQAASYTNPVDMDLLNADINDRTSAHLANSRIEALGAFGDMFGSPAPKFHMPGLMNPVDRSDLIEEGERFRDGLNDDDD